MCGYAHPKDTTLVYIRIILLFTLDYFQEELMTKFFKKSKKKIFGVIGPRWPFCPNLGKNEFSLKKGSVSF